MHSNYRPCVAKTPRMPVAVRTERRRHTPSSLTTRLAAARVRWRVAHARRRGAQYGDTPMLRVGTANETRTRTPPAPHMRTHSRAPSTLNSTKHQRATAPRARGAAWSDAGVRGATWLFVCAGTGRPRLTACGCALCAACPAHALRAGAARTRPRRVCDAVRVCRRVPMTGLLWASKRVRVCVTPPTHTHTHKQSVIGSEQKLVFAF